MGNQDIGYIDMLSTVKRLLKKMTEVEDSLSYLDDKDSYKWWEMGLIDIEINDIEKDTYYVTISVPLKIRRKRRMRPYVYYFYKIKGKHIERELSIKESIPTFKDNGKKVLKELVSILNSGNLVLKKGNAP